MERSVANRANDFLEQTSIRKISSGLTPTILLGQKHESLVPLRQFPFIARNSDLSRTLLESVLDKK